MTSTIHTIVGPANYLTNSWSSKLSLNVTVCEIVIIFNIIIIYLYIIYEMQLSCLLGCRLVS